MGYARELKYQICKRIFDGEITVEEASVEWKKNYKERKDL